MLIDHLPFAVVIADATGLVLLANDPALHALRLGEIIASRDGRIHVADPVASDRLHAAIDRACAPRESDPQPVLISVTPEAPWRQVVVMSITRGLDARYAALLFPDSRRLNGAARILASLFSFTAAEARMAVLVLEGRTLAQAASALGVRTRTALDTWKNVRLKLRTRTDSDCLRVLGAALDHHGGTAELKLGPTVRLYVRFCQPANATTTPTAAQGVHARVARHADWPMPFAMASAISTRGPLPRRNAVRASRKRNCAMRTP